MSLAKHATFVGTATLAVCFFLPLGFLGQAKEKLPRPRRLDAGVEWHRDPATGELRYSKRETTSLGTPASEKNEAPTLRVRVNLVEVTCNVFLPDATPLRGLGPADFRVFEDGVEEQVVHFDAASEPANVALVLDASPSVFREMQQMKEAARTLAAHLSPLDEVAVVAFAAETHLLLPFSRNRTLLESAIESVEVLQAEPSGKGSKIYEAIYWTAQELFRGRTGRKAILLLTDGQDSGLGLSWDPASALSQLGAGAARLTFEDVCRALAAARIEVYVISTQNRPKAMTDEWLAAHRNDTFVTPRAQELGMTHYTLYLAELVRRVRGLLYFLREISSLGKVYRLIAAHLRAQYVLGYYPRAGPAKPGWRTLRVELPGRTDARVLHRTAYYVPASP